MENIAAWCALKGSCVMEHFQRGREGKGESEQRTTQRTAVMVCVKDEKTTVNALCAFWVFEWKHFPFPNGNISHFPS